MDWELVRGDVKSLNWNGIIKLICLILLLNEDLLRVIGDRLWSERVVSLGLVIGVF